MSEHDNDNLERFFQKAAKEPKVEFNENDWLKLEARLDAKALRLSSAHPNRWRLGVASAGIILFFTGITYFFLPDSDQNKLNYSTEDSRVDTISEEKISVIPDSLGNQTQSTKGSLQANLIESTKKGKSLAENRKRLFPVNTQGPIDSSIKLQEQSRVKQESLATPMLRNNIVTVENGIGNFNHGSQDNPYQQVQPKKDKVESLVLSTQNEARVQEAMDNGVTESNLTERKGNSLAVPLSSKDDSINLLSAKKDKLVVEKSEIIAAEDSVVNSQKTTAPARWSMVFLFAPDFSSTGSSQYTSPGVAFGLVAHYHLNNTFSISTGLIRSNKKYWSYGNEYKPPEGYWKKNTNGIIPETIHGTCNVLEIPLALQYKVAKMKRSRIFITAGLSSYLMLNESYRFTFEAPNPGSNEGWNSSGTSRFLFSIANVSAGYERDILPNVAVGIEPYVKIPVTAIGWSGIKLFSIGASVTLRYSCR